MSQSSRSSTTVMPLPLYTIASRAALSAALEEAAAGFFREALQAAARASPRRSTPRRSARRSDSTLPVPASFPSLRRAVDGDPVEPVFARA